MNKKIAFLIIGDEILSGKTGDKNLQSLALKLLEKGYELGEVRVVLDDFEAIISAINELRKKYFLVFTSGGIGPTHDDITAEAISRAFERELEINSEAKQILAEYYQSLNLEFIEGRLRMARMPKAVELIYNEVSKAPGFKIENVCVLAGVPSIFNSMAENVIKKLPENGKIHFLSLETLKVTEGMIAIFMEKVQKKYLGQVIIGSYPKIMENGKFKLEITFRGRDLSLCSSAKQEIEEIIKNEIKPLPF